jgi:hypothetical protein
MEKFMSKQEKGRPSREIPDSKPIEEQAREQTGQMLLRVHVDEKDLKTSYANGFRSTPTAEELVLDFGLNIPIPPRNQQKEREMVFHVNNRITMNYFVAKRLAITLSQIVRRYEQEFGEIELNAAKRRTEQKK